MASSRVGAQASNVIPATATASIDIRLVKGMDPQRTVERVVDHIRKQGFFVVDKRADADVRPRAPEGREGRSSAAAAAGAVRTPMDLPISQEVIRTVESVRGPAVKLPNDGRRPAARGRRAAARHADDRRFRSATTTTTSTASTRTCGFRICGTASS